MSFLILQGDARHIPLRDESVSLVVTSPPYWGLRDYKTGTWIGGTADCLHDRVAARGGRGGSGTPGKQTADAFPSSFPAAACAKCGAVYLDKQIGLESSIPEYVSQLVTVFREVWRVLHPRGVVFLNLGDSYSGAGYSNNKNTGGAQREDGGKQKHLHSSSTHLKPKDLCGIPWRVAFALQDQGWYLRSDIIWAKPNPMPESVTDRPTKAHEYIFLLSKSERYYWDQEVVKEPASQPSGSSKLTGQIKAAVLGRITSTTKLGSNQGEPTRNIRSVWTVQTEPFSDAHFATMPTEIVKRCIMAGSSEKGCCSACGKPWVRIIEKTGGRDWRNDRMVAKGIPGELAGVGAYKRGQSREPLNNTKTILTTGWAPSCSCQSDCVPAVVFDPFSGSGTIPLVADRLGRHSVAIDLSREYCVMGRDRVRDEAPLFVDLPAAAVTDEQPLLFDANRD